MRALSLYDSKLTSIEAGAFQGTKAYIQFISISRFKFFYILINAKGFFGNWYIDLSNNRLTEFSSTVFLPILQQMNATNLYGFVYAINSKNSHFIMVTISCFNFKMNFFLL